jgi:hypothetical protein
MYDTVNGDYTHNPVTVTFLVELPATATAPTTEDAIDEKGNVHCSNHQITGPVGSTTDTTGTMKVDNDDAPMQPESHQQARQKEQQ